MRNKTCSKCRIVKPITEFNKNKARPDGYAHWCRDCDMLNHDKWYKDNANKKKEYAIFNNDKIKKYRRMPINKNKHTKQVNEADWACARTWLAVLPAQTKCECCGVDIYFEHAKRSRVINFDHRHGGIEIIQGAPKVWLRKNPYTKENKAIWDSCDFGMLCGLCNNRLPTMDRDKYLENITKYIKESRRI